MQPLDPPIIGQNLKEAFERNLVAENNARQLYAKARDGCLALAGRHRSLRARVSGKSKCFNRRTTSA